MTPLAIALPDGGVQIVRCDAVQLGGVAPEAPCSEIFPEEAGLVRDVGIVAVHAFPVAKGSMNVGFRRRVGHIGVALETGFEKRREHGNPGRFRARREPGADPGGPGEDDSQQDDSNHCRVFLRG